MTLTPKKIGILGGGQLARMLALSAYPLGINISLFAEENSESAPEVIKNTIFGSFSDTEKLKNFISSVDIIIFESEFVPVDELKRATSGNEHKFLPSLSAICMLQNKLNQKKFLAEMNLPTSAFSEVTEITSEGVYKWASLGYDGKGVLINNTSTSKSEKDLFIKTAKEKKSKIYREDFVKFSLELACIGVRSVTGETTTYPCVISKQTESVCDTVYGPAEIFGVDSKICEKVRILTKEIGEKAYLIGSFGVEFFLTKDNEVLINEIAPRVHNTGHYTQDACRVSQFENHIRAVLGMPLGCTNAFGPFMMKNILGAKDHFGTAFPPQATSKTNIHWYGKTKTSPKRKLGHINGVVQTKDETLHLEEEIKKLYKEWKDESKEKTKKNP